MKTLLSALLLLLGVSFAQAQTVPPQVPNPQLTPGVIRTDLTPDQIKNTKWGTDQRLVTEAMKQQVMSAYHMTGSDCPSGKLEIDHRVPRSLGGADDVMNLWPQCYEKEPPAPKNSAEWGAHKKDRLEDYETKMFRAGKVTLDAARAVFLAPDWRTAYVQAFGQPGVNAR